MNRILKKLVFAISFVFALSAQVAYGSSVQDVGTYYPGQEKILTFPQSVWGNGNKIGGATSSRTDLVEVWDCNTTGATLKILKGVAGKSVKVSITVDYYRKDLNFKRDSYVFSITVKTNPIAMTETSVSMRAGETHKLNYKGTVSGKPVPDATWSTSKSSVATVSSNGLVTAKSAGTAIITATSTDGETTSCTITVTGSSGGGNSGNDDDPSSEPETETNFTYTIIDEVSRTVSISAYPYTSYTGELVIPSTAKINGKTYTVTTIEKYAFQWGKYTSVRIPNSVTIIGDWAFSDTRSLTSVNISNTVSVIGEYVFSDCSGLTSVDIPNSVTSIGDGAFDGCSRLASVNLPNSVASIGKGVFRGTGLPKPIFTDKFFVFFPPQSSKTSYSIPEGIETICGEAFSDCSNLTSVSIPNSVTTIGSGAFRNCSSITSMDLLNSVTSIGDGVFIGTSLTKPIFNDKFFVFFPPQSSKSSYFIPEGIETICGSAFSDCSNLTSLSIPNSVTTIGSWAFSDCSRITSINIPNSVSIVYDFTFYNCTSLTDVSIGKNVKYIFMGAFRNCSSLRSVYAQPLTPPVFLSGAFENVVYNEATLYVNEEAVNAYSSADVWWAFDNIQAYDFSGADDPVFRFTILDEEKKTVSIAKAPNESYNGELVIPSTTEINGKTYTVSTIAEEGFQDCTK